jgi:hypothetical protein
MVRRSACFLLIAAIPCALMAKKEWKEGELVAVDIKDFETGKHHIDHRYLCTIADGELRYIVEFEKPVKLAVHDKVRFVIDKDNLILQDGDHKERSARIEKREREVR